MVFQYKTVSIIYGGKARSYAERLNDRIIELSEVDRYPIRSKIIMENILTKELLADVISLFKKSEFCVVFLTADDTLKTDENKVRLRQNVIFELGMALIQLGRERCILLSDFDVRDNSFELPSDMNSLEIRQFCSDDIEQVIDDIIGKILLESKTSMISGIQSNIIPRYNQLLLREEYYIDYDNLFNNNSNEYYLKESNPDSYNRILESWYGECKSFNYYDEKCIFLLERLCFLPMLGESDELIVFINNSLELISNYNMLDIKYYKDIELLNFTSLLARCVIEYTKTKLLNGTDSLYSFERLLDGMILANVPDRCNPLLKLVYYDYLGLLYLRTINENNKNEYLTKAGGSFKAAMKYIGLVDMSMQIWSGFLSYNLARTYGMIGDVENAVNAFKRSISIRESWIKLSSFNYRIRNA